MYWMKAAAPLRNNEVAAVKSTLKVALGITLYRFFLKRLRLPHDGSSE